MIRVPKSEQKIPQKTAGAPPTLPRTKSAGGSSSPKGPSPRELWMDFLKIDKRDGFAYDGAAAAASISPISTAASSRRPSYPEMDMLPMIQPFGPGIPMPPLEKCHKRGWSMPALNLSACSSAPELTNMQISPLGDPVPASAASMSSQSSHAPAASVRSNRSSTSQAYAPAVMSTRSSSACMSLVSSAHSGRPSASASPRPTRVDLPAFLSCTLDPMLPVGPNGLDSPGRLHDLPGQLSPKTPRQDEEMLQIAPQLLQFHNIPPPPVIKEEEEDDAHTALPNIDLMKIASRTGSPISSQPVATPAAANGVQPPPMPPLPNWNGNSIMLSDALLNLPVPPVPIRLPHPSRGRAIPKTKLPRHVRTPKSRRRTRSSGNVLGSRKRRSRSMSAIPGLDPALVERIRKLAADHHLSQVDIMRGSGISNTILSDWLKHKYRGNLCEINNRLRYYCDKMECYYSGKEVMPAFLLKPCRSSRSRINLGELIPIEMDLDFGTTEYQDFFLWDPDEIHITPKIFAEQTCRDLDLARNCAQIIQAELSSQIEHGKKSLLIIRDVLADNTKKGETITVKLPRLKREIQWNLTDINTTPEEFGKMLQNMWSLEQRDALYISHRIRIAVLEHFCPPDSRPSLEARRRSARAVFNMLIAANQSSKG